MSNNDFELATVHTTANPEPPSNPTTPIESKVDAKVSSDENKSSVRFSFYLKCLEIV